MTGFVPVSYPEDLATARVSLGQAAFAAAWAGGAATTLEQAVAEALEDAPDSA
jgi:hypothetical protein